MFDQALAELDVAKFWENGYAILPDVYTDDEVEQMRQEVREHCGSGGGDLTGGPLRHALVDGKMAAVAGKLLGTEKVLYGGDSSATINGKIRAWHKDNTDRLDQEAPDWDDRYTQLRFGIYLQDHTEHTGGLNLKVGSHDICDLSSGKTIYCQNSPRDLLVWSMRITHSGAGTLLKDPNARFPEPEEWNAFPEDEVAPGHDERMAIFAHLGANDKHGQRYLDYLKTRTYIVNAWRRAPFTPDSLQELDAAGFTVRNLPAEVKDDKRAGKSKDWEPFFYLGMPKPEPEVKVVYRDREVPAPTPPAPQGFTKRYGRAVKRRVNGVKKGWAEAAPKGSR